MVLEEEKRPLSSEEIWQVAQGKGYDELVGSKGKTPPATIGAQIYIDIRDNANSPFIKVEGRPRRFSLKTLFTVEQATERVTAIQNTKPPVTIRYAEAQLHPFLAYFAYHSLKAHTKTIVHSRSNKKEFGEWVHPDIVGCYIPIEDWTQEVIEFGAAISNLSIKLFSFELKRNLSFDNLRESFFQAVSNSSWANEGYLVAANISGDEDFRIELQRLSSSFGIGVIEIDTDDPVSTSILYPAQTKDFLDWETINKIASLNPDFRSFLRRVKTDLTSREIRREQYDQIQDPVVLVQSIQELLTENA
jgi:hypothetical protein